MSSIETLAAVEKSTTPIGEDLASAGVSVGKRTKLVEAR
jgi:hypothetical protein